MRIRSIKPEWLEDERMALASAEARVLSVALILLADDEGRGRCNPEILGARVFPGVPDVRRLLVEDSSSPLRALERMGFVLVYESCGQMYYAIRQWKRHQRIDRPTPSRIPEPPDTEMTDFFGSIDETTTSPRRALDEPSPPDRKGREGKGKDINYTPTSTVAALPGTPGPDPEGDPPASVDAVAVFTAWRSAFGLDERTKFTVKRRRAVVARLRRFKASELVEAIEAFAANPWRHEKASHFELATLMRNDEKIENELHDLWQRTQPARIGDANLHKTDDLEDLFHVG